MEGALPDRGFFSLGKFFLFHTSLCLYFTAHNDLHTAIIYGNTIMDFVDENEYVEIAHVGLIERLEEEVKANSQDF